MAMKAGLLTPDERLEVEEKAEKYKEDLKSEAAFRKEMEASWNMRGEEFKCGVTEMEDKLRSAEQKVEKVRVSNYLTRLDCRGVCLIV